MRNNNNDKFMLVLKKIVKLNLICFYEIENWNKSLSLKIHLHNFCMEIKQSLFLLEACIPLYIPILGQATIIRLSQTTVS